MVLMMLMGPVWASVDWVVNNSDTGFDPVPAGGNIQYLVTVANNGITPAPATTLTLTIPPTTSFVSATGLSCMGSAPVTCNVPALSGVGGTGNSVSVTVVVRTTTQGIVTLGASVPTTGDADPANNTENQSTTVIAGADIALSLSGPASAPSGSTVSYTFTATNNGPDAAGTQTLSFPIPTGLVNVSPPAGCSLSGSTYTCSIGGLALGASATRTFTGQIAAAGGSTLTASGSVVAAGTPLDPIANNNTATLSTTITPGSDLRLTKSRSPAGTLLVGQSVTFTLSPSYTGDSPNTLTITDSIPSNYTIGTVASPQNGWTCSVAGQTVTCTRPAGLGAGNNVSLGSISIPVTAISAGTGVTNTATIGAASPNDPNPANNTANDGGVTIQAPTVDLRANKSGPNPAVIVTGQSYTWSISASNLGNAAFHGTLVMTDALPAGVTVNSYTLNGWSCSPATPVVGPATITCQRVYTAGSPLAANATTPSVGLNFTATTTGSLVNAMTVSSPDANIADSNSANDNITHGVTASAPIDAADVRVVKTASPGIVAAGDVLTYTLEVVNDGPQASSNITLSDDFTSLINNGVGPTGAGYIGETVTANAASGLSCSTSAPAGTTRRLTCTIATLPVCTQGTDCPVVTVQVRPGGNGGSRTNSATAISSTTADPNLANNTGSVSSTVTPRADVTVSKSATPSSVPAGQNLTYVVTASNLSNGLSAAANVTITDTLPHGVVFVSATPSAGSCATLPTVNSTTGPGNDQVVCNLGTINNGAQQTVTLVVRPTTATRGSSLTNAVTVSTTTAETNSGNNSATVATPVGNPSLDLLVNKTDSIDPIAVGDDTVYTITVTNNGPSAAENLVVTDTLPASGLSYQSNTVPAGGSCPTVPAVGGIGGNLVCTIPYLPAAQSRSFTVTMRGVVKGVVPNSVSVASAETGAGFDSNPANNTVTENTTVRTKADMQVESKTPSANPVNLRDSFNFVVRVRNNTGPGLAEADGVVVSDTLPAGMQLTGTPSVTVVSGSVSAASCTGTAGATSFSCSLGTVSSGAVVDISIPVKVVTVTTAPQTLTNTASVTTTSLDINAASNSASGPVTVNSSSLAGRVFRDFNNDGAVSAGDTGIAGVTMTLTGTAHDGATITRTVTTDANGNYSFGLLPAGVYTIAEGTVSEAHLVDGIDTAGSAGGNTSVNDTISAISLPANTAATGYTFAEVPQARVGIAKRVTIGPTNNADGTFNVSFELVVRNYSLEALNNVTVTDSLAGAAPLFGTHNAGTLDHGQYKLAATPTGTCTGLQPGYTGGLGADTLAVIPTLTAGASCTIALSLQVKPTTPLPPVSGTCGARYCNQASVTGTGALSGQTPNDLSDNGASPDPDNDGQPNEAGENDATPVAPSFNAAIGIAKQVQGGVTLQADGSVLVPIRLVLSNIGNEPLNNVVVSDPLASATGGPFGSFVAGGAGASLSGGQYTVQSAPAFIGACVSGTANPGYTGSSGGTTVASLTSMATGASCTIEFTYRFMPQSTTTYVNQASASGTGGYTGTATSDLSDNGANPDPNGNGNAGDAGENDPTPVPYPRLALAKQVNGASATQSDGSVIVPFRLVVRNTGGEALNGVTLTDTLAGAAPRFGSHVAGGPTAVLAPGQYTIQVPPAFAGPCAGGTANATYNGNGNPNLATIASLAVGASCTLDFSLRFRPQPPLPAGGYLNQANASGTGASSGLTSSDLSDDGANPDSNGNGIGNEAGENDPTPVSVSFTPRLGLAKAKPLAETIHPDGTVSVPFRVRVQNFGNEPLVNLSVTDILAGPAPRFGSYVAGGAAAVLGNGQYSVEASPSLNGACPTATLTPGYTGEAASAQIATLSRLEIGAACEFNLTLRFRPQSPLPAGGYSNSAAGSGTGELSGSSVADVSHNGTLPDANGNGDPGDDNAPTPVNFTHTPALGIAKRLNGQVSVNPDGSLVAPLRLVVANLGNEPLNNVEVSDPLAATAGGQFGAYVAGGAAAVLNAGQYTVQTAPAFAGACANGAVNAGYTGDSGGTALATIVSMATNTSCTLDFVLRFRPATLTAHSNQAQATGSGAYSGTGVSDLSDDGANPDPNGNGNAGEAGENDPTPVPIPRIGVAKQAGSIVNHGDGSYSVPFTLTVHNYGQTPLSQVQVTDTLTPQFGTHTSAAVPAAGQYTIVGTPTGSGQVNGAVLAVNPAFTGSGANTGLLNAAGSSLPNFGASASRAQIAFTVRFFPTTPGPFNNGAQALGAPPGGGTVTDASVSGTEPDANGNGDPADDAGPTVVDLAGQAIGVAKRVEGGIVQTGAKRFRIPYALVVRNLSSTVTATNVQVSDDLVSAFPTAFSRTIVATPSVSDCTGTLLASNPAYTGSGVNGLLVGNQNLQPGEQCTIRFTVEIDFGSNPLPAVPQNNQARATTAQSPGGAVIADDLSDEGANPDPNGNGNANEPGENDPTPVSFAAAGLSAISGKVYVDANHDRSDNDPPGGNRVQGFIVEVLNAAGQVVGSAVTDANGNYSITGLFPSTPGDPATAYRLQFRDPVNGAIWGQPQSADPVAARNGSVANGVITGLQLAPGVTTVQQNLPLDPSGVVYDAVTRNPIAGAQVTLTFGGAPVPSACLVGGVNTQTTGPSGAYQYLLINPAPAGCPGDGVYELRVTEPTGYLPPPSAMIPPAAGPYTPSSGGVDAIQAQDGPPPVGAPTTYYLSFALTLATSSQVVNNHIPIDPILEGALQVTKTTPLINVSRGDLVPYTLTVRNTTTAPLSNIALRDLMPPGFKYKAGSARLDGVAREPAVSGRQLEWGGLSFAPGQTRTIKLLLVVGAGVGEGEYTNTGWAMHSVANRQVSNTAQATVRIVPDPTFDCSEVIGKVFDDRNANGYQDEGEPGIANVRLATARGLLVTTDAEGRFHVACADVPQALRGSNFIMKLDERTLPSGYRLTTENPREVRLTRGKMAKLNFGATIHRVVRVELSDAAFRKGTSEPGPALAQALERLPASLRERPSVLRLAYRQSGEETSLIRERLKAVRTQLERLWRDQGCCYALQFEEEVFQRAAGGKGGTQ